MANMKIAATRQTPRNTLQHTQRGTAPHSRPPTTDDAFVYRIAGKILVRTAVTPLAEALEGVLVSSDALRPGDSVLLGDTEDSGMLVF